MAKSEIRKKILNLRIKSYSKNLKLNSKRILSFFRMNNFKKKIGFYYPFNYEVDILSLVKKLEKKNYSLSLPKIGKNNTMNFYKWSSNDPLSINHYGIAEPITKKMTHPDVLLIPLVAFDDKLNRLGYGGGFYDRTIQHFRQKDNTKFIGICYPAQIIPKLPRAEHDQKLDFLVNLDEI